MTTSLSHLRSLLAAGTPGHDEAMRKSRALLETTWHCEKCWARHPNDLRGERGEHDRLCGVNQALLARALMDAMPAHNALPDLLAIAEAAVAFAAAQSSLQSVTAVLDKSKDLALFESGVEAQRSAYETLLAALDKVKP